MTTVSRCPSTAAPFSPSSPAIAAGGRVDPRAPRGRQLDPLGVIEQRPDGEDRRGRGPASRIAGASSTSAAWVAASTTTSDALEQVPEPEEGRGPGQAGQELARPARRRGWSAPTSVTPGMPGRQRPRHGPPDRPQSEDPDAARRSRSCAATVATPRAAKSRRRPCYPSRAMARGISAARAATAPWAARAAVSPATTTMPGSAATPSSFPRATRDPLDREIVALLSASLAYGRVSLFGAWLGAAPGLAGPVPPGLRRALRPRPRRPALRPVPLPVHAGARRRGRRPGHPPADRSPRLAPAPPSWPGTRTTSRTSARRSTASPSSILEQDFRPVGMARPTRGFRHLFPDPAHGGRLQALAPLPPLDGPPGSAGLRGLARGLAVEAPDPARHPHREHGSRDPAHAAPDPDRAHGGRHHRHAPPARPRPTR